MKFNERYKDYKTVVKIENGKPVLDEKGDPVTIKLGAMDIFNDYINGTDEYGGLVKILSCACIEKDFEEEELLKSLSFDFPTMKTLDAITMHMIQGSLVFNEKGNNSGDKQGKN
jgi:hypothetical protein